MISTVVVALYYYCNSTTINAIKQLKEKKEQRMLQTERDKERERQREIERDRERQRERERERERDRNQNCIITQDGQQGIGSNARWRILEIGFGTGSNLSEKLA